jgi:hypothetical protein
MSQAYPMPPSNGMLSFAKSWLRDQDITGAKARAKRKGELRAAGTEQKQQAAKDWADVTIGSIKAEPGKSGTFYDKAAGKYVDIGDVMSIEEKQSAITEAQTRQLGKQAEESFARARAKKQEAERSAKDLGFHSDFYKNLTEGQNEGYRMLAAGGPYKKVMEKIPKELLPKFLQQIPQMRLNPEQMDEFIVATINNGESFLDENQKFLSKEKAKGESFDREQAFQAKLQEQKQKISGAKAVPVQSAIEQVRSEYAGMNPDQVIAHYQSKYGQPKQSLGSQQSAINRMEDQIDQMAASKLGMKYSKNRGLY